MNPAAPSSRVRGLTLIEAMVVLAVSALLLLILLPTRSREGVKSNRMLCARNLKDLAIGFRLLAGEGTNSMLVPLPADLGVGSQDRADPELAAAIWRYALARGTNVDADLKLLWCPADRARKRARDLASLRNVNISYFLNLAGDEARPEIPLAGDRNLAWGGTPLGPGLVTLPTVTTNSPVAFTRELHDGGGNLVMSDAHVEAVGVRRLRELLAGSNSLTSRFVFP